MLCPQGNTGWSILESGVKWRPVFIFTLQSLRSFEFLLFLNPSLICFWFYNVFLNILILTTFRRNYFSQLYIVILSRNSSDKKRISYLDSVVLFVLILFFPTLWCYNWMNLISLHSLSESFYFTEFFLWRHLQRSWWMCKCSFFVSENRFPVFNNGYSGRCEYRAIPLFLPTHITECFRACFQRVREININYCMYSILLSSKLFLEHCQSVFIL